MAATDSTGPSNSSGPDRSTDSPTLGGWSDRVLGLVCFVLGVFYTIEARTFDGTAFGSGPVGPKTLPTGIGIIFCAIALYIAARPDASPRWPTKSAAWQIGLVVAASYLFGRMIEPVGFIISSILMTIAMGLLFRAPPAKLIPLSIVFPVVLAFIFNNWLELRLPAGWWGGF